MLKPFSLLLGAIVLMTMWSCGGSGSSGGISGSGRAAMTFQWPARTKSTRLIPIASNSIKIDVTVNGLAVTSQTVARPAGTETSTLTFNNLPAGDLVFTAAAFPSLDGTGTAQAKASVPVHIVSGGITPFAITMDSTIDHLEVTPNPINVIQNQTINITITARNKTGDAVLISGSTLTTTSNDSSIASVFSGSTSTKLTGLQVGTTSLFIKESESTSAITVPVTVAKGSVPSYTSQSLSNGGGTSITPTGINDNGDVIARAFIVGFNTHVYPYIYVGGVLSQLQLGTAPVDTDSAPLGIRNDGVIVGSSYTFYGTAVEWATKASPATRLAVIGSTNSTSEARSINSAGTIVGVSNNFPAIWTSSTLNSVPAFPGGQTTGYANCINDSGRIVGAMADGAGNLRAFSSDGTTTQALPDQGHGSNAKWISSTGDIVGSINVLPSGSTSTFQHAALWHNGVLTDLGTLPGDGTSEAACINSSGVIVGTSNSGGFLIKAGVMYALTSLASGHGPITAGVGINTSGQIVAVEKFVYTNPILLTPN